MLVTLSARVPESQKTIIGLLACLALNPLVPFLGRNRLKHEVHVLEYCSI